MYTVGVYDCNNVLLRPLRIAETKNKAVYLQDYYIKRLKQQNVLKEGQSIKFA